MAGEKQMTGSTAATVNRRSFLKTATVAGAAALGTAAAQAASGPSAQLAQARPPAAGAVTFRVAERLAGSGTSYAYAAKAGPFIFLPGHEAYDFQTGLAADVEGPSGYPG